KDLADDPRLDTNAGRLAHRERIVREFSRRIRGESAAAWRSRLDAAGVPNGVVLSVLETLRETNSSAVTGMPSSVGGSIRFPPPALDEHGPLIRRHGWAAFGVVERWNGGTVERLNG